MYKLYHILFAVLCFVCTANAQYGFYNLSGAEGTWKDEYSNDNLKLSLNPATGCGKVTWNPNYYIEFSWQVKLDANGQPEAVDDDIASQGNATFYRLSFTQTGSNAPDIAQFGSMIAYYSPSYQGSPAVTQYTRMWYCKRVGGNSLSGNCGGGTNSNSNSNNNTNGNNTGSGAGTGNTNGAGSNSETTANSNTQFDSEILNMLNQMQQYLANGNTTAANNILNQILNIAQHAYPDQLDDIQNLYNQYNSQSQPINSSGSASNSNNNANTNGMIMGDNEVDYPEGWGFLQEFQNMLNEYIRQYNLIVDGGGNVNNLVAYANRIQEFMQRNQHIFGKLTKRQMEVMQRMMDYFQKAMLQAANISLGKLQRIERCNYAEIANTGHIPAISTPYMAKPTSSPTPTGTPSNSNLSGASGVTPPSINGTGPDGMKRP